MTCDAGTYFKTTAKQLNVVKLKFIPSVFLPTLMAAAVPAAATQTHGGPEGLVVHQFSHIFFFFSMGLLIYWIRTRGLHRQTGWRYIQFAAALFMVWTLDAFATHLMDEHFLWVQLTETGLWQARIEAGNLFVSAVYYLAKMDHLWCVPALLFMYLGLKRLNVESRGIPPSRPIPGEPEE
ncbi:MAG: hypothetical protein SWC96_00855 [Thermodesulfobacteriota bacterium]|nr:hypothetical protein [Thermodesulfobacteriota bacterium]